MVNTLVIVPAFNEGKHIFDLLTSLHALYPEFDILVINDGSADNTREEARRNGVFLINHPFNLGYGVAIQTGYKFAIRQGYDYVIQIDGDGQHNPQCIRKLHDVLINNHADLVLGSRFNGNLQYTPGITRRIGMRLFRLIVNLVTHLRLSDVTTGFQGLNRRALYEFSQDSFPTDYPDADTIIMAHQKGLRIVEVPVTMRANGEGKSMHAVFHKNVVYVIQMIISIVILLLRKHR